MTTTITRTGDAATITPSFVDGYETRIESNNVVHRLVSGSIAATLVPHLPRAGTLNIYFETRADAWAAIAFLTSTDTFELDDDTIPEMGMVFIVGDVAPALESQTRRLWYVPTDYQEMPS